MRFDDWTAEARRSLEAWDPEPATRPTFGATAAAAGPTESEYDELSPGRDRPGVPARRRLLAAVAAAAVITAGAVAATTLPSSDADTDVAAGQASGTTPSTVEATSPPGPTDPTASTDPGDPTGPTETTAPVTEPTDPTGPVPTDPIEPADTRPGQWTTPWFDCSVTAGNGAPTDVFDTSPDVAAWRAVDVDDPSGRAPTSGPISYVQGALTRSEGEDLATTRARGATVAAALAPTWRCTTYSPRVDVADPSQPGPIVDEHNTVTNRLGGMCLVPDATGDPDAVWGVDPNLAAAIDQVEGVTDWQVTLADGGGDQVGPDQLWMEFSFAADPGDFDEDPFLAAADVTRRVEAEIAAAAASAGAAAGVATRCNVH